MIASVLSACTPLLTTYSIINDEVAVLNTAGGVLIIVVLVTALITYDFRVLSGIVGAIGDKTVIGDGEAFVLAGLKVKLGETSLTNQIVGLGGDQLAAFDFFETFCLI